MLTLDDLDKDQSAAADVCVERDNTFLVAGMGAGKSIIALTAIEELLWSHTLKRVLVLAPLRVCATVWACEHLKWQHTKHMNVGVLTAGNKDNFEPERYDIVAANFDMIPYMADSGMFIDFDGLVIDESTKLKSGGAWFKALRHKVKHFEWRLVMTGTPVSENWQQLFYQMFLVDGGETLGGNRQAFLDRYFYPTDFKQYNWAIKPTHINALSGRISPYVYTVPDYTHQLPPLTVEHIDTPLPPDVWPVYNEMAGKLSTLGVTAQTAAVKVMKLQQIANGFLYDENKHTIKLHDAKIEKLKQLKKLGENEAIPNLLVIYQFQEELAVLRDVYGDEMMTLDEPGAVDLWNSGRLNILCMHPKSGGHGLNLAPGGNRIVWLSPPWSNDLFRQTNARLWRRGQIHPVTVYVLTAPDTVDQLILTRLQDKSAFMPALLEHLAAHRAG